MVEDVPSDENAQACNLDFGVGLDNLLLGIIGSLTVHSRMLIFMHLVEDYSLLVITGILRIGPCRELALSMARVGRGTH